jgi:carboxylesterase
MSVLPGAGAFYFEGSEVGCLLIHGYTGTPQSVRPLGDFLARRGLTVLAPRLAGHGTSTDDFEQTGPQDWIGTANAALDQLRQSCSSVFAIGVSMGGTLALHLAETRGDDLAGVGCINAPVGELPDFEAVLSNEQVPERFPVPWHADPRLLAKDLSAVAVSYSEVSKQSMHGALGLFKDTGRMLGQVRVPVMLFYSRDDHIVPPITGQRLLEQLTAARDTQLIELVESAHVPTIDFDAERIGLEWLSFIRQHTRVLTPA